MARANLESLRYGARCSLAGGEINFAGLEELCDSEKWGRRPQQFIAWRTERSHQEEAEARRSCFNATAEKRQNKQVVDVLLVTDRWFHLALAKQFSRCDWFCPVWRRRNNLSNLLRSSWILFSFFFRYDVRRKKQFPIKLFIVFSSGANERVREKLVSVYSVLLWHISFRHICETAKDDFSAIENHSRGTWAAWASPSVLSRLHKQTMIIWLLRYQHSSLLLSVGFIEELFKLPISASFVRAPAEWLFPRELDRADKIRCVESRHTRFVYIIVLHVGGFSAGTVDLSQHRNWTWHSHC